MAEVNKIRPQEKEFKQYDSCIEERKVRSRPDIHLCLQVRGEGRVEAWVVN